MPRRKTWDEVNKAFRDREFILLSKPHEYVNKLSRLTCMDEDGYLYYLTYDLVSDKRTKKFSPVEKRNKYSIQNIQHWINLKGSSTIVLSKDYLDEKYPIIMQCECGEIYTSFWNRMSNIGKCRCNKCGEKIRTSRHTDIEQIKKEVASYGYYLIDENIDNIKNIIIADKDGNIYNANLFALRYGYIYHKMCGLQSSLEIKTANYLDEIGIKYETQKSFDDCRNIHKLRFDFYLPDYNIIIETHGEQHYKDCSDRFGFTLEEQQNRDLYKKNFCINNNIKYVEIPYSAFKHRQDCTEEYKEIINKILE